MAERLRNLYSSCKGSQWLQRGQSATEVEFMLASIRARMASEDLPPLDELDRERAKTLQNNLRNRAVERFSSWTWHRSGPQLSPCPTCASPWLARMRLREPTGYVCLECRRDHAGITWPARFDAYVASRDVLLEAGAPLSDLAVRTLHPHKERSSPNRRLDQLSSADRKTLLDRYVNTHEKVADLAMAFGIAKDTLYAIVHQANAPTRYPATRARRTHSQQQDQKTAHRAGHGFN